MRKFSWMLLMLLACSVYAEDEAEELKGIADEKIIWEKDGAVMMSIPASDTIKPFWMDATEVTVGQFKNSWNHQTTKSKPLMILLIGAMFLSIRLATNIR